MLAQYYNNCNILRLWCLICLGLIKAVVQASRDTQHITFDNISFK